MVDGGDAAYLCHWIKQSGLASMLRMPSETVWVCNAGSMVVTPCIGPEPISWPTLEDDCALGIADLLIFLPLVIRPCRKAPGKRHGRCVSLG